MTWYKESIWDRFNRHVKDKRSDSQYSVDHLERLKERNSAAFKYPDIEGTQTIFIDQIIPVKVVWQFQTKRKTYEI